MNCCVMDLRPDLTMVINSNSAATIAVLALASRIETAAACDSHNYVASYSLGFINRPAALPSTGHVNKLRRRHHQPSPSAFIHHGTSNHNCASLFDYKNIDNDEFSFTTGINRSPPSQSRTSPKAIFFANRSTIQHIISIKLLRKFCSNAAEYIKMISFFPKMSSVLTTLVLSLTLWWATAYPIQSSWAETNASQYSARSTSTSLSSSSARTATTRQLEPYSILSYPQSGRSTKSQYRQFIHGSRLRSGRRFGNSSDTKHIAAVQRISLVVLSATIAASTYRATQLRNATGSSKPIRNVTPYGIIRNQSPLGNGVSVIRVSMALGFDRRYGFTKKSIRNVDAGGRSDGGDDQEVGDIDYDGAMTLLKRLHLEEKELYTKIAMLANQQLQMNQQQPLPLKGSISKSMDTTYNLKQKALVDYVSNVASTFLPYQKYIRYGSLDSVRVPFVEDAIREFRQVAKDDRLLYESSKQQLIQKEENNRTKLKEGRGETLYYVVATIVLAIKGDHTTVPIPMLGVLRQRDVARALLRIAIDAKVQDCLVASEVRMVPDMQFVSIYAESKEDDKSTDPSMNLRMFLSEAEVLRAFPNLIPLLHEGR